MRDAVIVAIARTGIGKAFRGSLNRTHGATMAGHVIRHAVERARLDPAEVEDVVIGCGLPEEATGHNIGRAAALRAGLPVTTAGMTVNRYCSSGLQSISIAAQRILTDGADILIAGGVESMTRAPLVALKPDRAWPRGGLELVDTTIGWRFPHPDFPYSTESMGETAENVAQRYGIAREDQDAFALESHRRAIAAQDAGLFDHEIVPVEVPQRKGEPVVVEHDEGPRRDTSLEKLARLRPVFRDGGTVTAGNSSQINDGAACLLLASAERARELGLSPLARVVCGAAAGVDPAYMGIGPIPATRKLLARTGKVIDDFDLVELNEAFASQVLACIRELGIDHERLNVNGGAIAIGHPLGCSGARLAGTICHELARRGGRLGLVTMCVGVGQGVALAVENLRL
ncbi:MAG: thiolase family protein [Thermoleophilum sp.]|nr:thiolase family protein [Thermoleophilum sp.]